MIRSYQTDGHGSQWSAYHNSEALESTGMYLYEGNLNSVPAQQPRNSPGTALSAGPWFVF